MHKTKKDGIWVTYQDGVYDITDFVDGHPGGKGRIMMAAGQYFNMLTSAVGCHSGHHSK